MNIECSPVRIFFLGHPRIDCNPLHRKVPKINPKKSEICNPIRIYHEEKGDQRGVLY